MLLGLQVPLLVAWLVGASEAPGRNAVDASPLPVARVPAATPDTDAQEPTAAVTGPTIASKRAWIGVFGGVSTANADGLEGGAVFGGGGAFYFTRNLGLELAVERQSQDVVGTSTNGLSGGSLDSTVFTGSVLVRFPVSSRVAPYLLGGVAYYSSSFEVDPAVVSKLSAQNFRLTEDLDSKLGFSVGGGLDVLFASRLALFGELRYLAASADTQVELADTVSGTAAQDSGSQDLNGLEIRAGIRVVF